MEPDAPAHTPYRDTETGMSWDGRPTEVITTWCCDWHQRRHDILLDEPEPPDHEPWSRVLDDATYAEPSRTIVAWCCQWHELHPVVRGHV